MSLREGLFITAWLPSFMIHVAASLLWLGAGLGRGGVGALDGLSQIEAKSQAKIRPGWLQAWSKEPLLRLTQPLPQQQHP